jgi:T5orf172 domain
MLYLISDGEKVKIGVSENPEKRLSQLQTGHPKRLKLIKIYNVPNYFEKRLHRQLWMFRERHNGEWFTVNINDLVKLLDEILL